MVFDLGFLLGFAPDVDDGDRPERNEIHSWNKLDQERREKFPMPPEKLGQQGGDPEVEDVIGGRQGAFDESREYRYLQHVGNERDEHSGLELRSRRNCDLVVRHKGYLPIR